MVDKETMQIRKPVVEQLPAAESDTLRADLEQFPSQHILAEETVIDNEPAVSSYLDVHDVSQSQARPPLLHDQPENFSSVSTGNKSKYACKYLLFRV